MKKILLTAFAVGLLAASNASATIISKSEIDISVSNGRPTEEAQLVRSCRDSRWMRSGFEWIGCLIAGNP